MEIPTNICFFDGSDELGGGELWIVHAARLLASRGHGVALICPYRSRLYDEAVRMRVPLYAYEFKDGVPFQAPIRHFLVHHRIDVVHCTVIGRFWEAKALADIAADINRERADGRIVVVLKTGLPPMRSAVPEFYGVGVAQEIRRLHVVCESTRRAFIAWDAQVPESFVEVAWEGIDLTRFDARQHVRDECRRRFELPPDARVITCVARLHPDKGQDNLLLAAHELRTGRPDLHIVFAGEGGDRHRLEQLAAHLEGEGRVRFLGRVDDVPALLAASDIVCHPSLNDSMPNAVVEAMAMGRPVVASELQGIAEIVEHGVSGLLAPPHDIHALISNLGALLDDPAKSEALGRHARGRVQERFDLRTNVDRLVDRLAQEQAEFDKAPGRRTSLPVRRRGPVPVMFLMTMLRTGGEETELGLLARHLDTSKFRLSVLSCWHVDEPAPVLERLRAAGIPVDTGCHALAAEAKIGYIVDHIRRQGIRVVVACQDTTFAYAAFQQLGAAECRLIEHGGIESEARAVPKDRTDRYIGVSPAIADAAGAVMNDPGHALCIPSMVDPAEFDHADRQRLREGYGFPQDDCVIVYVGRLDPKKRLEDLIAAAAEILPRFEHVRFLLVGPPDALAPEHANALIERARPLAATGRFLLTGGRSDVAQILCASDIFVLASTGEGMSHAINEAGAAGLAVVATEDGAAREQLDGGRAGRLFTPGRTDRLVAALTELIEDKPLRRRLGARLRERVRAEYSPAVLVQRWEAVLRELSAGMDVPPASVPLAIIKKDEVLAFPREIQIQTNTLCNATCIMCPYPAVSKEFAKGEMAQDLYDEILAQCAREPGLWRIEPFLMNEPFVDRRMVEWIAQAKRAVPHALVTVTTNGTLVRPNVSDRLVNSGLDAIWFSFNGATKSTFEKIMGCRYETVVANIDYLLSVRPASLQVFTNMIETTIMEPEIEENIRRWTARGVGSGSSKLVNRGGNVDNYAELNFRPLHTEPVHACDLLYNKMYILYNGDAVLCCMDWRRQVVMGNVREQSLREIWAGEKYQHYRRLHEEGRSRELSLCSTCSYIYN